MDKLLKFTKMEGIGNDYIYFDGIHQNVPMNKEFIQKISHRNYGIGSDGMIVILDSNICDFKMRMFNLDGSEGKMCGNGIRCFAKFVYENHLTDKDYLEIETLGGIKKVWLNIKNDKVVSVKVDMGEPVITTKDIPCLFSKEKMIDEAIEVSGREYYITSVSMGNPHAVIFVDDLDFDISVIGKQLERHPLFPESVNTEFVVKVDRNHLKMRVWERGSGETLACGTGACASFYASYLNDYCDDKVQVSLKGGTLDIELKDGRIYMTGPARTCFEGMINDEEYYVK